MGPRNQQIVITQGEVDDLKAAAASQPSADASALQKELDQEKAAHAVTSKERDGFKAEIEALKKVLTTPVT